MKLEVTLAAALGMSGLGWGRATVPQDAPAAAVGQPQPTVPGVYRIGGDVKPPVPISMPDPKFSREARKKKMGGVVLVGLIVDVHGNPQQVHVVRSAADKVEKKNEIAALTLDAKAIEAVESYRFRPAMLDGRAVPVEMRVEVNFRVF